MIPALIFSGPRDVVNGLRGYLRRPPVALPFDRELSRKALEALASRGRQGEINLGAISPYNVLGGRF